jgi:thiamine biosynthesis lipoprotein
VGTADSLTRLRSLGFQEVTAPALVFAQVPLARDCTQVIGTRPALGTRVSVSAISSSAERNEVSIAGAFAELDRLAGIFSRYESDSALSVLNDAGHLAAPPPELVRVFERALYVHALSRGAFDVTVKPVMDLLAARFPAAAPSASELRDAAARVGACHLAVKRRIIRFQRPGMGATLDGIAKGYIVDRMADLLTCHGIHQFLIDAGGDIRVNGLKQPGRPWTVAVRDPATDGVLPQAIALRGGAVATSGGYERFYDPGRRFHHLIDPSSGCSPAGTWSVSVIAPNALAADALATTVYVLGPDAGLSLLEQLPDCAGMIVTEGGAQRHSRRWNGFSIGQKECIA